MSHPARYTVTYGLSGCYMPDSNLGAVEFTTRRDLAAFIRSELEVYGMPKAAIAGVKLRRLWGFIRRNGSSVAHFSVRHGAYELTFYGLTRDEYDAVNSDAD